MTHQPLSLKLLLLDVLLNLDACIELRAFLHFFTLQSLQLPEIYLPVCRSSGDKLGIEQQHRASLYLIS